jgi:hypothetical protein
MAAGRIRFPLAGKVPRARADKYLGASQDRKAHVTRDRAGDEFGLSRSHRPEDFAERRLATRQDLPERSLGLDFSIRLARTSDRERKVFLNISSAGLLGRAPIWQLPPIWSAPRMPVRLRSRPENFRS